MDDHEVENNYANDISQIDAEPDQDRAIFRQRRAAAYQAWYEHMPVRSTQLPAGPDLLAYRRLRFGDLAEINMLDTRQYRSDQPCGGGLKPPCDELADPARTITGPEQESWLKFFSNRRGFVQCEHTPHQWRTDFQEVPYVSRPGAPLATRATFVIESGRPGAEQVGGAPMA